MYDEFIKRECASVGVRGNDHNLCSSDKLHLIISTFVELCLFFIWTEENLFLIQDQENLDSTNETVKIQRLTLISGLFSVVARFFGWV